MENNNTQKLIEWLEKKKGEYLEMNNAFVVYLDDYNFNNGYITAIEDAILFVQTRGADEK